MTPTVGDANAPVPRVPAIDHDRSSARECARTLRNQAIGVHLSSTSRSVGEPQPVGPDSRIDWLIVIAQVHFGDLMVPSRDRNIACNLQQRVFRPGISDAGAECPYSHIHTD